MHPVLIHPKYSSEERVIDDELDLLSEVNVYENVSVSSRRFFEESCISSNMDHDDSWEVTIVRSLSSQATSLNDTLEPIVRVLNTVTEHEGKRDLYSSFDGHTRNNEKTYTNAERPIIASSLTYERLNDNDSRRSFDSDKRSTSILHGDRRELDDRMGKKPSKARTGVYENTNNGSRVPFIELGAVYKVFDFITDFDPKVSSLTNNCCNEISRTLRYLIAQRHDKKLDDLLLNDSSLYRCERCGVISHMLKSNSSIEENKRNETGALNDTDIMTAERNCVNAYRNKEESRTKKVLTNHSNLKNNTQLKMFVDDTEIDRRTEYEDGLNEVDSLPVRERSFIIRCPIESPNGGNNVSNTEAGAKIKNATRFNNSAIKSLFADYKAAKRNVGYEFESVARKNDRLSHDKLSTKVCTNIDTEKVVRKISYENKSQTDNFPVADWRCGRSAQKSQGLRRLFRKDDDIVSIADTVKYLARGQFTISDKKEDDLLSKLQDRRCARLEDPRKRQSSVLHGSRDDYPRCESGFWLFDKSGHLPGITLDEYRYLPMSKLDNNNGDFRAYNTGKNPRKTGSRSECMEKDSLENCTLLERREESDTMTFSSSSAENLIYEWMGTLDGRDDTNDTDREIPRGRRLISSRPSLDIARHVRAEIAEARRSNNARESTDEPRARDSDVLARLSPDTRNKICHSIGKMILSDVAKDSMFCREKNLTTYTDALNGEKLARSGSSNVILDHSDKSLKVSNEIINTWLNDCIPTKLSQLSEDKSQSTERRKNAVETNSKNTSKSEDRVKILDEYPDKLGKTELVDDFSGKIARRIIYKNVPSGNVDSDNGHIGIEISPVYREILENSEGMDWDDFRELIENLHPGQKEMWRDVCKTVYEEAERAASDANGSTEVCIEISPVILEGDSKTDKPMACGREIAFELDMTLKDVESFLNKRPPHLAEKRLDTPKDADEGVADWNDGGRKPISKQAC